MSQNNSSIQQTKKISESIFEQIKRYDEHGKEYWLARELMPLLDYVKWQNFLKVIDVAKENLETVVGNVSEQILLLEVKSKTKSAEDYKLSRLAAYHVALSCDSRGKENVKLAKHYFAVKTREAEVLIPQLNEQLELLRLQNENLRLQKDVNQSQLALQQHTHLIVSTCPEPVQKKILGYKEIEKVEYRDRIFHEKKLINNGNGITKSELCQRYGFYSRNGKISYSQLNRFLEIAGVSSDDSYWEDQIVMQTAKQFRHDKLAELDDIFHNAPRQLFMGE